MEFVDRFVSKMATVLLKSMDGAVLKVSMEAAKFSKTIGTMLSVMEEDDAEPIPLMKVEKKVLGLVFDWVDQKVISNFNFHH